MFVAEEMKVKLKSFRFRDNFSMYLRGFALLIRLGVPAPPEQCTHVRQHDLGVSVVPLDWSNREWLEDWAVAHA